MATARTAPAVAWPWPRTRDEVERGWLHVELLATRMAALAAPGTSADDLGANGRCLLGMRAAAMWTTGRVSAGPMTRRDVDRSFGAAYREFTIAERLLAAGLLGWDYASGVMRWLSWVLEVEDEVRYPPV